MNPTTLFRATGLAWLTARLGQWLLYLWVRTTVLPPGGPTLDRGKPVFYVLETRSLSNRLVLAREARRLGLPSPLAPCRLGSRRLPQALLGLKARPRLFGRPPRSDYSTVLGKLLAAVEADPGVEVQLQPVSVFWGRSPERPASGLSLLFPDDWPLMGRLRKFLLILVHGRNTWVEFSPPISLRRYREEYHPGDATVRKLALILGVHFRRRRQAVLGPELPGRRAIIETLVNASNVRRAIREEAAGSEFSEAQLRRTARKYAEEIAAGFSYPLILLLRRVLHWLWHRLYDGIELHHFNSVREALPGNQVIYVPCHRSHVDYMLILYLLYSQGLALPRVAAGINLNAPGIGFFVRQGGAFFLRRTFKGNRLYAAVLDEYMSLHLARGVPIKYFIEGGRSRTGFLLAPKMGMLDMTVRGFFRYPYRPVVFVPMYIGYERLLEGESYLAELRGEKKHRESLLGLIRNLWVLRRYYGKVYLNVGEPLDLERLLATHRPDWRAETRDLEGRPDWLPPLVESLAREIQIRVNEAAAVTPMNLLALVLLGAPRRAMAEPAVLAQLALYQRLLRTLSYHPRVTVTAMTPVAILRHARGLVELRAREDELGRIVYLEDRAAVLASYFRNNSLHLLALPALLARAFRHANEGLETTRLVAWLELLYPPLRDELFLRWAVTDLAVEIPRQLASLAHLGLLVERHGRWYPAAGEATLQLALLGRNVDATVERLAVVLLMLAGGEALDETTLLGRYRRFRERVDLLHQLSLASVEERIALPRLLESLLAAGILQRDEAGRLTVDRSRVQPELALQKLLPPVLGEELAPRREVARDLDSPVV